jgi:hypothetical protein
MILDLDCHCHALTGPMWNCKFYVRSLYTMVAINKYEYEYEYDIEIKLSISFSYTEI